MCGRYQRRSDKQKIAEAFQLGSVDGLALEFAPVYNAAPQSTQPVIVWDEEFGTRSLQMMFWRFLPPFVTDPKPIGEKSTVNPPFSSPMPSPPQNQLNGQAMYSGTQQIWAGLSSSDDNDVDTLVRTLTQTHYLDHGLSQ